MRTDITVCRGGTDCDLAIESTAPVAVAQVWAELVNAAGLAAGDRLWHGDAPLAGSSAFGRELRTGALVSADGPVRAPAPSVLALHQIGGPGAGRVFPLGRRPLVLGRGGDCDVVLADPDVSRRHAQLAVDTAGVTVLDLASANATLVDGRPIAGGPAPLALGQTLRLGDCAFAVRRPEEAPASVQHASDGSLLVRRAPRTRRAAAPAVVAMPAAPRGAYAGRIQWAAALLPALAGGAIAWATHSPQFLVFALLSPVLVLSTSIGDRLHWRRSTRRGASAARRDRAAAQREIAAALAAEAAARSRAHPDPAVVARLPELPASRLWERRPDHDDFGLVRLGTAARPASTQVREDGAERPAGLLRGVPVVADLCDGPLGVAGPPDVLDAAGRWLVGQLVTARAPTDLQLVHVSGPSGAGRWRWSRWCAHVGRAPAADEAAWQMSTDDVSALVALRSSTGRPADSWRGPWLVVVVDRTAPPDAVAAVAAAVAGAERAGVTAIFLAPAAAALPAVCRTVVHVDGVTGTRASVVRGGESPIEDVVLDQVDEAWAERLGRALAPFADRDARDTAVPASCDLLEVLGLADAEPDAAAATVRSRWSEASGGANAVLGASADGPLALDLVADGPHLLVAGTTGAGKSELLQALVVGLAADEPPESLTVLLIDYKGGAAFAECAALPHCAGLVTDLDGQLTQRALTSLGAELRRRELAFAEHGAADLGAYRAAGGAGVPRLVIVVDEFATLAEELPDFMRGLIAVAQRGRSLGVHLVLATQRPGSAVSADIRANTAARIALRVTGAAESKDVIDAPDAAGVQRHTPGRAYLRVGSSLTCFQAAHPGAPARDPRRCAVSPLDDWRRPLTVDAAGAQPSQLNRVVAAICAAATTTGRPRAAASWLAPLPVHLSRAELRRLAAPHSTQPAARPAAVPFALVDLPQLRRQDRLELDLATPSALLAVGAGRSGRTTLLTSLAVGAAESMSPADVELHIVDGAGALADQLEGLPALGTALRPDDAALATRLFRLLADRDADSPRPALLLVDAWDAVLGALGDADALDCADALSAVLRSRARSGVTVALAGDRAVLAPRLASLADLKVVLRLADRSDYALAGVVSHAVPTALPPGRAVRADDGALLQVAHAGTESGSTSARHTVEALAKRWRDVPAPADAIRLRSLPESVRLGTLPQPPGAMLLGVGGDRALPCAVHLFAGDRRLIVAGPPRSGRSTLLISLFQQAVAAGVSVAVAAPARSPLAAVARNRGLPVFGPAAAADDAVGRSAQLLLVDDCEAFADAPAEQTLMSWTLESADAAVVVAGRADDLATAYRGLGALVRRSNCGVLLRPGPVDGEILGVRLPRRPHGGPPGRGVLVPDPRWGAEHAAGEPLALQVALP